MKRTAGNLDSITLDIQPAEALGRILDTLELQHALEHALTEFTLSADGESRVEVLLDRRDFGSPILDSLIELVDEFRSQGTGEVRRLDQVVRPGIQILSRLVIATQHHISLGPVEQGLVGREGRIHGMGIADTGHRIGILEQVRDLPEGHLVESRAAVPFRTLPIPGVHVSPTGLFVTPDVLRIMDLREIQEGIMGILRDTGIAHVITESGVCGHQHQIGAVSGLDVVVGLDFPVLFQTVAVLPVAQDLCRLGAQALGRIFCRKIPLLIEEVETGGESIRSLDVEVILGYLVIAVVDIAEGDLQILLDLVINLRYIAALILGIQLLGNAVDIRDAEVLVAGIDVVVQGEEVDQHEVVVCAA